MRKLKYTKEQIQNNRNLFLSALESGKFKKGKGALCGKDDSMCCLGVAAEIFIDDSVEHGERDYAGHKLYNGCDFYAPDYVIEKLGLINQFGINSTKSPTNSLAEINDNSETFEPVINAIKTGEYWIDLDTAYYEVKDNSPINNKSYLEIELDRAKGLSVLNIDDASFRLGFQASERLKKNLDNK